MQFCVANNTIVGPSVSACKHKWRDALMMPWVCECVSVWVCVYFFLKKLFFKINWLILTETPVWRGLRAMDVIERATGIPALPLSVGLGLLLCSVVVSVVGISVCWCGHTFRFISAPWLALSLRTQHKFSHVCIRSVICYVASTPPFKRFK